MNSNNHWQLKICLAKKRLKMQRQKPVHQADAQRAPVPQPFNPMAVQVVTRALMPTLREALARILILEQQAPRVVLTQPTLKIGTKLPQQQARMLTLNWSFQLAQTSTFTSSTHRGHMSMDQNPLRLSKRSQPNRLHFLVSQVLFLLKSMSTLVTASTP